MTRRRRGSQDARRLTPAGRRLPAAFLVVLASTLVVPPVASGQTLQELDDAQDRVDELDDELGEATQRFEDAWAKLEASQTELDDLRAYAATLEHEAVEVGQRLGDRARTVYKYGSTATMQTLLNSSTAQEAVERAGMLAALQLRDGAVLEETVATRVGLDRTRELVRLRELDLLDQVAELEREGEELESQLAEAQADLDRIEARLRTISRGPQQGVYSCIFDPGTFRFRDSWGAPRSGGRAHRGTDVFAARSAPVYAFTTGTIQRHANSALGGISLYLRGDDGHVYFYAHLESIDASAPAGARVAVGQLIARNGSTGNAPASAPHVHFEVHPGGGGSTNPYPWLAAACF